MTTTQQIEQIFAHVSKRGTITNTAKSDWGVDTYLHNGVEVGLGDAGYSMLIRWGDRLHVYVCHNQQPVFKIGNPCDLEALYEGICQR